ncbi:AAA family ATPase [Paenarthrobacter sp. AB444]|uniref:AAA family ATPase n=1 Tax=Paenarthrobacter sp. AB444 TaxID=3025681 RepID=UPI003FD02A58
MQLGDLRICNFMSCLDTEIDFREHVTVLVGENGSGKSKSTDAIRLLVPSAIGHRSFWFGPKRDTAPSMDPGTTAVENKEHTLAWFFRI